MTRTEAQRQTSNKNQRGGSADRKARRYWLASPKTGFGGDGVSVECAFDGCTTIVRADDGSMWVDRFPIPGRDGGTYKHGNIRPSCAMCQTREGAYTAQAAMRDKKAQAPTMER